MHHLHDSQDGHHTATNSPLSFISVLRVSKVKNDNLRNAWQHNVILDMISGVEILECFESFIY